MYDNTEPTDMYEYEITTPLADLITTTQNNTWDVFNSTLGLSSTLNSTLNSTLSEERKRRIWVRTAILTMVYLVGIIGNATAIVILRIGKRRVRNRKHLLLLTSLAANDLVALLGMLVAMVVSVAAPQLAGSRGMCAGRVVLRVFGIGSVCIAVTMALERYLALTRPFFYQKQVTYFMIRLALLLSWLGAVALACAPLLGVGLYYDATHRRCARYRNADTPLDVGYAIFYVVVGTLLCVILVYCNLAVIRALYAITSPHAGAVVRRVSRRTCARDHDATATPHNAATAEEVAFSRFMTTLSVLFMICWLPQMLSSVLYLALGKSFWDRLAPMSEASDVLMLLNYVLNPVLYVLMRGHSLNLAAAAHCAVVCFKRKHKSSHESGSCCLREETTVVVSDSGSELRPLAHVPTARLLHTD